MTLQLGTLNVDIDGDVSGLNKAEAEVTKSTKKINNSLKNTDKQVKKTSKGFNLMGRNVGQASIQVQQFVGQVQGGQNVMLAFSQQAADFGIVLGAPLLGVVVALSAGIAGALLPSLFGAKDATEDLENAMKALDEILDTTEDGALILSEAFIELTKRSDALTRINIAEGIVQSSKAIAAAATQIEESFEDAFGTFTGLSIIDTALGIKGIQDQGFLLINVMNNVGAAGRQGFGAIRDSVLELQDEFNLTTEDTVALAEAMSKQITENTLQSAVELRDVLGRLGVEYASTNEDLTTFAASVLKSTDAIESAKERSNKLKQAQRDLSAAIEETNEASEKQETAEDKRQNRIDKYIESLRIQVGALGLVGGALGSYRSDVLGATGADKEAITVLQEKLQAFKEAAAAEKELEGVRKSLRTGTEKAEEGFATREESLRESLELEQITRDEFSELQIRNEQKLSDDLARIDNKRLQEQQRNQMLQLQILSSFHDVANTLIQSAGKEGTAIAKAAFLAGKAIQVATIIAQTEVAAAAAGAVGAAAGPGGFFASAGVVRAAGFASAGLVAGLAVSETFQDGGIVGGSSFSGDNVIARVNSGEMILNSGQQRKLFNMANGDNSSGGGMPKIVINNNAGVDVSTSMSDGEIMFQIDKARKGAVNDVNQSLSTGRGNTSKALNRGFKTERNIR